MLKKSIWIFIISIEIFVSILLYDGFMATNSAFFKTSKRRTSNTASNTIRKFEIEHKTGPLNEHQALSAQIDVKESVIGKKKEGMMEEEKKVAVATSSDIKESDLFKSNNHHLRLSKEDLLIYNVGCGNFLPLSAFRGRFFHLDKLDVLNVDGENSEEEVIYITGLEFTQIQLEYCQIVGNGEGKKCEIDGRMKCIYDNDEETKLRVHSLAHASCSLPKEKNFDPKNVRLKLAPKCIAKIDITETPYNGENKPFDEENRGVAIGAIIKNIGHFGGEWIGHHLFNLGYDHIIIYFHNTDENVNLILKPYIDQGKLTIVVNK